MSKTLTGIFGDRVAAERAVTRLVELGVNYTDISILMSDQTQGRHFKVETTSKAPEGAAGGAAVGGALGAIAAGLGAVGTLSIPGLSFVAAGPIIAALAGAGAGGAAGGLIGGLLGLGLSEHEAQLVKEELERGRFLLGVVTHEDQAKEVKQILEDTGAKNVRG